VYIHGVSGDANVGVVLNQAVLVVLNEVDILRQVSDICRALTTALSPGQRPARRRFKPTEYLLKSLFCRENNDTPSVPTRQTARHVNCTLSSTLGNHRHESWDLWRGNWAGSWNRRSVFRIAWCSRTRNIRRSRRFCVTWQLRTVLRRPCGVMPMTCFVGSGFFMAGSSRGSGLNDWTSGLWWNICAHPRRRTLCAEGLTTSPAQTR
jgi:hypothetical protein